MVQHETAPDAWLASLLALPPQSASYVRLQEQGGMVFDRAHQCWLISDPGLIRDAFSEPGLRSSRPPTHDASADPDLQSVLALLSRQILLQDGAEHERLKALMQPPVQQHFHRLRSDMDRYLEGLLAVLSERFHWDLVRDFAHPFAYRVMASLLGLTEQPKERLYTWGRSIAEVTSGQLWSRRTLRHVLEMRAVCLSLARERRRSPHDDLLSTFVLQSGWRSDEELVENAMTIFGAGVSTLPKAIAHSVLHIHDASLGAYSVEQLLCQTTPTRYITRWASTSLCLGSHHIEQGQQVYLLLEGANQEITTRDCKRHLAFGLASNPHYCLGTSLARFVLKTAVKRLLARFPDLQIVEQGAWGDNPNLGSITSILVTTGENVC